MDDKPRLRPMTPEERLRRLEEFGRFFFGPNWRAATYRLVAVWAPQGPTYLTQIRWNRMLRRGSLKADVVPDWMLEACAEYVEQKFDELARMRARFRGK
jgi:hypothetical protein